MNHQHVRIECPNEKSKRNVPLNNQPTNQNLVIPTGTGVIQDRRVGVYVYTPGSRRVKNYITSGFICV